MDRWKPEDLSKFASVAADLAPSSLQPQSQLVTVTSNRLQNSHTESRHRPEAEAQDPVAARKLQKADREKLRRDRLNEHFLELGNTLDPDRPKNDKATILTDTIQVLKDLSAEVDRLKAEHAALSEESHELMQEKNELREEKISLKSDIENLNSQYQQRVRVTFPWTAIDHSVVMAPPYSYPVPIPISSGPISLHPSLQPFPFFGNQSPGPIPNPCSTYVPFSAPVNPPVEQPTGQYASTSNTSSKQDSRSKSPDHERTGNAERCRESNDVATKLELKIPGSSSQQESSCGARKGKHSLRRARNITDGSTSSRHSSSQGPQDSSNSVGDNPKSDK
ncbi:transcription factor bHLH121 isoform X1 [Prosopis cineraria]|uniref:transcription factor bHLH121 isoform X1 n=1 Tax=Prosopis cineraria TaxID=364024 RepID=UPI00240FC2A7|nr:transcription factor bHLH121 isoform X1 [Prosopis cineraria]